MSTCQELYHEPITLICHCCISSKQADHLREQTLRRMSCILTTHQAARGLLALGEYFHRLRALSSLWVARPCESV